MGLTAHQEEKLSKSIEILKGNDRLLILGSAGVGKTYLVNELVKRSASFISPNGKIVCAAPTNKAVAVVKEKVDERNNLDFTTVHSALKIKRNVNFKTGVITFVPNFNEKYPPLKQVSLFIIDESSMIESKLLEYIETYSTKNKTKVIFIGDQKQLNPVNEEVSPVFKKDYPEVELTEIIRQGEGNPIIELSRNLDSIKNKRDNRGEIGGYIHSNNLEQVVATLAAVNGTDELKYLAWTNKEIDNVNRLVRQKIYGINPNKIELDETLVFNEPFKEVYYTNQEIKVEELEVKEKNFSYPSGKNKADKSTIFNPIKLKYYSINENICVGKKEPETIIIIHEDSEQDFNKLLKNLQSMCLARVIDWVDFYAFKETFANTKYNHAITVHKSQGSTYKQVIVNIKNISLNRRQKEKDKLLYTAITRASKLLILYKA